MVKLDVKVDDPERREMVKQLLTMLGTEGFKDAFLEELNDAVDIPMIGEKKEYQPLSRKAFISKSKKS